MTEPADSKRILWAPSSAQRPVPNTEDFDTGGFWSAAQEHKLIYSLCSSCARTVFYPRAHCPQCGSVNVAVCESRGIGTIHSYTMIHRNPDPAFSDETPYTIALVDLSEGFRLLTRITGDPAQVSVGQPVELAWTTRDGFEFPFFKPSTRLNESGAAKHGPLVS